MGDQITEEDNGQLCRHTFHPKGHGGWFTGSCDNIYRVRGKEVLKGALNNPVFVIPAKAGIQGFQWVIDTRLRGNDDFYRFP